MSLYYVQKLLYNLNRDPSVQEQFLSNLDGLLDQYKLTDEEREAIRDQQVGELYIMGVNGQILMHYSAFIGQNWDEYIQSMKDALKKHGQVKAGLYATIRGGEGGAV